MSKMITIETRCPICCGINNVEVKKEDWARYENGEFVQRAFPYLDAATRELLITGICNKCWQNMCAETLEED